MEHGIPVLTQKGRDAIQRMPPDLTARCRNILVQVDGKRSVEKIFSSLQGLEGLAEAFQKLLAGQYVQISLECKSLVTTLLQQMLGPKAPTLIKKIEEMNVKYGEHCWEHMDELDRTARLFYGEVVADKLQTEISKIVRETK
jgi:hypothetical protein